MLSLRIWMMASLTAPILGRRYSTVVSSRYLLATSAGSSQLARWAAKISAGLPSSRRSLEPLVDLLRVEHVALVVRIGFEHLQAVDMGEFGGDPAEIVPDRLQDVLDLGCGLFRKCRREIGAADPVLLEPRAEPAHEAAGEVGHAGAAGGADRPQHAHGQATERRRRRPP